MSNRKYTLRLTVRNRPGVLVRCIQVYSRRGHNIESLSVKPVADDLDKSHLVITACSETGQFHHIAMQLNKLVDVLSIDEEGD